MKFTDFIVALDNAGWRGVSDAQHENIQDLHRKMFPVIAGLENEIVDLSEELTEHLIGVSTSANNNQEG